MRIIVRFLKDTNGATAIEYAMIAGLISIMIIAGARSMGTSISAKFVPITNNLS